jgi:hypothetical protein
MLVEFFMFNYIFTVHAFGYFAILFVVGFLILSCLFLSVILKYPAGAFKEMKMYFSPEYVFIIMWLSQVIKLLATQFNMGHLFWRIFRQVTTIVLWEDKKTYWEHCVQSAAHGEWLTQFIVASVLEGMLFQFPTWNLKQQAFESFCSWYLLFDWRNWVIGWSNSEHMPQMRSKSKFFLFLFFGDQRMPAW